MGQGDNRDFAVLYRRNSLYNVAFPQSCSEAIAVIAALGNQLAAGPPSRQHNRGTLVVGHLTLRAQSIGGRSRRSQTGVQLRVKLPLIRSGRSTRFGRCSKKRTGTILMHNERFLGGLPKVDKQISQLCAREKKSNTPPIR